jgi:phosphatidate phosphatase APP1
VPVSIRSITAKILLWLRITRQPVVRVYDGYGDEDEVIVYGHVLRVSPLSRQKYRQSILLNLFGLIRLFMVVPVRNARVIIEWNGETRETHTGEDGLFRFEWKPLLPVTAGWQKASVSYISPAPRSVVIARGECSVFIPHVYQYNFISDIDDTFLISHSGNLLKRLYVLFTKNARSRKPFEGVVNHYRMLSLSGTNGIPNPFFYVSSSEWNLYEYIREFCRKEGLPRGIFLLSQMKRLRSLLYTGQGKHATKYIRIARILKAYPAHRYVLLGDNTQADPEIYFSVARDFPGMIAAVYIRKVSRSKEQATLNYIRKIQELGVECCYFLHSREAIEHSRRIGLILPQEE